MAQQNTLDFLIAAQVTGQEQMAKLIREVGALRAETDKLREANKALSSSTDAVVRNGVRYNNALDAQSKAMRQQRQGAQQLTMQMNDFFTSVSTGASPVQAFNQQIGQIGYALTLFEGNAGKVGRLLSGPFGIALMLASVALGKVGKDSDSVGEKFDRLGAIGVSAGKSIASNFNEMLAPAIKALGPVIQLVEDMIPHIMEAFANMAKGVLAVFNRVVGGVVGLVTASIIAIKNSISVVLDLGVGVVNAFIRLVNMALGNVENTVNFLGNGVNTMLAALGVSTRVAEVRFGRLEEVTNRWAGSAVKTANEVGEAFLKSFRSDLIDIDEIMAGVKMKPKAKDKEKGGGGKGKAEKREEDLSNVNLIERNQASIAAILKKGQDAWQEYWDKASGIAGHAMEKVVEITTMATASVNTLGDQMSQTWLNRYEEIQRSFTSIGEAVSNSFQGMLTGAMSWKDGMKGIINAVINELWRLFVVQQIVGMITGGLNNLFGFGGGAVSGMPSMYGAATAVGSQLSGSTQFFGPAKSSGIFTPGFANGTQNAPGGMAWVGERGPELVNLPRGSQVIPAHRAQSMGGGGVTINVDARGSADPAAVRAQVQQGIIEAAPSIIAAAEARTVQGLRRPRLGGAIK